MIPVILTHRGNQDYVRTAIRQAKRRNERVVLIGDETNKDFGAEHYLNADYWQGAAEFAKVYRHMSHNPYEQELYCFQIYFVLKDWARAQGIERLFTMDSDVMLYCDVTGYEKTLGDYDLAINWCERQEPYRWSACLHNSFWKLPVLEEMCDFLMKMYETEAIADWLEEKWAWHQENKVPGGVCDMTLLYFFKQNAEAVNLSRPRNKTVWDDNFNIPENYREDEYEMWDGHKAMVFYQGQNCPRCWSIRYYMEIGFNALHFQGQAKRLMEGYEG